MSTCIAVAVATVWTSPEAPRPADAAATAGVPDLPAWTAGMGGAERRGLHGRTLTQALLGEPVEVPEESGDWARVSLPWQPHGPAGVGYSGWVRTAHVGSGEVDGETVAVRRPSAVCRPDRGEPLLLSYGTVLPLLDGGGEQDAVVVRLPDGRDARLDAATVRRPDDPFVAEDLLASARQFLGLRYLWGGTCGWGVDCSGLVHLVHRVHGVTVPRDASDQHEQARTESDTPRPGGLYFFARPGERAFHVGFASADGHMLHAPESGPGDGGLVEDAPMAPERADTLVGAGRFAP